MFNASAGRATVTTRLRKNRQLAQALTLATIAAALGVGSIAHADTYGSNGGTPLNSPSSWIDETTPSNTGVGVPGALDIAQWDANYTLTTATPLALGADTSWLGIKIFNPASAVTIGVAVSNLTLGSSGIDMSAATQNLTLDPLSLILGSPQTWTVAAGRTLTITGPASPSAPNTFNAGSNLLTVAGPGNTTFTNLTVISSTGGLLKTGSGTLEIDGNTTSNADSFGSSTLTINGGILRISVPTNGLANPVAPTANVSLGGAALDYAFAASVAQSFTNLTLTAGESFVRSDRVGSFNASLNFTGTITRNAGATLDARENDTSRDQTVLSSVATTPLITSNGVAYVTLGNPASGTALPSFNDWGAVNANHQIVAAAYTSTSATSLGTAAQNANVNVASTTLAADATDASFRDNYSAAASVVDLGGHTFSTGGILVTALKTKAGSGISNGTLKGPAGQDLVVLVAANPGTPVPYTISANIVDNVSGSVGSALTKGAPGTLILSGTNTFTNGVYINDGVLQVGSAGALNATTPQAINFDGSGGYGSIVQTACGTIASSATLALGGFNTTVASLSTANNATGLGATIENANGASVANAVLTVNGSTSTTFAGTLQNGSGGGTLALTKAGTGTLTLQGINTFTGNTIVSGGTLAVNSSLSSQVINVGAGATLDASASTSGFNIASGKTLMGSGTVLGSMNVLSAGTVSPGDPAVNNGIGTLTVSALTLNASSTLNFDMGTSTNDLINVTANNGLTINGGPGTVNVNLFQANTSNAFTTSGVYDLFAYAGTINGNGLSALNDLNLPSGTTATFGTTTSGGVQYVTVTLAAGTVTTPTWALVGGGSWNVASDWTPPGVPSGSGVQAIFGSSITAPSTVTLDATQTVGVLTFSNTNSYTIAATGSESLVFDNGANPAKVNLTLGSHIISAPVVLNSNLTFVANGGSIALTGTVSEGSAGMSVSVGGSAGVVSLLNTNTYTGGTAIGGATLAIGNSAALGTGSLSFTGDSTLNAAATGLIVANNVNVGAGINASIDTNGNALTLSGVISSSDAAGSITKKGTGTLILTATNTFADPVIISQGVLQVGDGVTTGSALGTGAVTVNGSLVFNLAAPATVTSITVANVISGIGSVVQNGPTALTLSGANSYNGLTINNGGTVNLTGNNNGQAAAGSGPITISNGTLNVNGYNLITTPTYGTLTNPVIVPAGGIATINMAPRGGFGGGVSGSGTLNIGVQYTRNDISGDWSGFTGQVNVVATTALGNPLNGDFRLNTAFNGSNASFNLGTATNTYVNNTNTVVQFGNLTGTGSIGNGGAAGVFSIGNLGVAGVTDTFNGAISGGSAITKVGPGILDLAGANSFTGAITVSNGMLNFVGASAVPSGVVSVTLGTATTTGTLDLNGFSSLSLTTLTTVAGSPAGNTIGSSSTANTNPVFINFATGTSTFAGNIVDSLNGGTQVLALTVNSGNLTLTGTNTYTGQTTINGGKLQLGAGTATSTSGSIVSTAGTQIINTGLLAFGRSDNVTFAATIAGSGNISMVGTGVTTLTGANTYSGTTTVTTGTLQVGVGGTLGNGTSALTIAAAGKLDLNGNSATVGSLAGAGTVDNFGGTGASVLTTGGLNADVTFSGAFKNTSPTGTLGLTKLGTGTLTLSGTASTNTGASTLTSGAIFVNNAGAAGTSALGGTLTLNGGTLGGSGIMTAAITGGTAAHTISPGNAAAAVGTLTVGSLSANANTTLLFDLSNPSNPTTPTGGVNDVLAVTGNVAINGATVAINTATNQTGAGSLGYYKVMTYGGTVTGLSSAVFAANANTATTNVVYTLDTTHDTGAIDIHRGYLGDANDDGNVDTLDLQAVLNNLGSTTSSWSAGNFDGAAKIDLNDLNMVLNHLGASIPTNSAIVQEAEALVAGGATATPEPTSLGILALGAAALISRRRKA